MPLLYGWPPNCTCVQLPGSGCQTGFGDSRLNYVDAFTLLRDAMHPTYGHPKALTRAYDHVYHEDWGDRKPPPEKKEDKGTVSGGVPGGIRPNCTPFFNIGMD